APGGLRCHHGRRAGLQPADCRVVHRAAAILHSGTDDGRGQGLIMRQRLAIGVLAIALVVRWLWFWTELDARRTNAPSDASSKGSTDTVTVWVSEMLGSPDESYYYQLADLWNSIEPGVHLKMSVLSHAGYDSKLRVAIASGQPPDVCFGGIQ